MNSILPTEEAKLKTGEYNTADLKNYDLLMAMRKDTLDFQDNLTTLNGLLTELFKALEKDALKLEKVVTRNAPEVMSQEERLKFEAELFSKDYDEPIPESKNLNSDEEIRYNIMQSRIASMKFDLRQAQKTEAGFYMIRRVTMVNLDRLNLAVESIKAMIIDQNYKTIENQLISCERILKLKAK